MSFIAQTTTLLQMFCEILIHFKDIFESVICPDDAKESSLKQVPFLFGADPLPLRVRVEGLLGHAETELELFVV